MNLTDEERAHAAALCTAAYPLEAVVFVATDGVYAVDNIADDPTCEFKVAPAVLRDAVKAGLRGVIHSHPDGPSYPSSADMASQLALGVPFGIFTSTSTESGEYFEWGGAPPELYTRPFRHGVTDCYAFIRDYYRAELGISLPDYPRDWAWWFDDRNLYLDNVAAAGFTPVALEGAQRGDMLLITLRGNGPCHGAVYLGDQTCAQHMGQNRGYDPARMPTIVPLSRWAPHVTHVFRHKDAPHGDA